MHVSAANMGIFLQCIVSTGLVSQYVPAIALLSSYVAFVHFGPSRFFGETWKKWNRILHNISVESKFNHVNEKVPFLPLKEQNRQ